MSIDKSYDQWAEIYDQNLNKTRDLDGLITREILGRYQFDQVIELGCGTGKNTLFLEQRASQVYALDFSEKMLAIARDKVRSSNVSFRQADILQPWFEEGLGVDLICCNLVLEHIEKLDFVFVEAARQLREGGLFFLSEFHPFKQYQGSKARFDQQGDTHVLEAYVHHVSDFFKVATDAGFILKELGEHFDLDDPNHEKVPRLISFVFSYKP